MSEIFNGEGKVTDKHIFIDTPVLPRLEGDMVYCSKYKSPREKAKVYRMPKGYRVRFDRD